jgi:EAL and modified HD-GYP domain-containing signal transduction protein
VEAVDDAVQLLGRGELRRWLSVQLAAAGPTRVAAGALEQAALARGRLLEALARHRGDSQPGAHFTLGLLSMIEPLLQVPLAQAIAPLRLADEFESALLRRVGPWADRLSLLELLDAGQTEAAAALALELAIERRTLDGMVQSAWSWSSELAGDEA